MPVGRLTELSVHDEARVAVEVGAVEVGAAEVGATATDALDIAVDVLAPVGPYVTVSNTVDIGIVVYAQGR